MSKPICRYKTDCVNLLGRPGFLVFGFLLTVAKLYCICRAHFSAVTAIQTVRFCRPRLGGTHIQTKIALIACRAFEIFYERDSIQYLQHATGGTQIPAPEMRNDNSESKAAKNETCSPKPKLGGMLEGQRDGVQEIPSSYRNCPPGVVQDKHHDQADYQHRILAERLEGTPHSPS